MSTEAARSRNTFFRSVDKPISVKRMNNSAHHQLPILVSPKKVCSEVTPTITPSIVPRQPNAKPTPAQSFFAPQSVVRIEELSGLPGKELAWSRSARILGRWRTLIRRHCPHGPPPRKKGRQRRPQRRPIGCELALCVLSFSRTLWWHASKEKVVAHARA